MKSLKIIVILSFLLSGIFACSSGKATRREFNIGESKSYEASIFRQNCAVCHGQEANGKQMADGKLIPSLRYGDAARKSEEEIYNQIKEGKLPMPAFKNQLSEKEIRQMVQFIRRDLQGKRDAQK
ncbi:MAG: cytochrome c [Acidobacteriota bacterium]|nr:cytochrome c [Acidobacteriota bacterium]